MCKNSKLRIHWILPIFFLGSSFCSGSEKIKENRSLSEQDVVSKTAVLRDTPQETLIPTKWDVGDTTVSNEDRLDLLIPHVQNVGNAYVGVGSEQNLTIAAWAKSDFVYLMDFTQIVVHANEITILFLKKGEKKEDFIRFWGKEGEKEAFELIGASLTDPDKYKKVYKQASPFIRKRHRTNLMLSKKYGYKMFQTDDEQYTYIRKLALDDRILPLRGNLLGSVTLTGIGNTLKKAGHKLGIIYFSNAEEYFAYPQEFKNSIINLPVEENSLVVRTISVRRDLFPWSPGSEISTDRGFHYCVQKINNFQKWLASGKPGLRSLQIMAEGGTVDKKNGITVVDKEPVVAPAPSSPSEAPSKSAGTNSTPR
ncbi:hypothetical protein CH379_013725 [Leptospira ellisii]|uniref:DUF7790 domain-containing protein n=1 Tax=Leptospira ellisii TaxID=2023197 RepID=A0A2N0B940_9LEPT|nr:hypothetical protein [Leptospira ellisii]MDV6236685.1 hypothetical protein [Leptospira ellisii]PJZ93065.1 hypothetical protein CH379_09835 [Leptospira ellisii]PKA04279.1 hypothetical protein CH375_11965 [Leptospira ellisii]